MKLTELKEALQYGSRNGGVDALFSEAADPDVWERIRCAAEFSRQRGELDAAAEKYRVRPIRAIPFSLYRIFDTTGSRIEYEAAYFERRGRLATFAASTLLYGKPEDIAALEDAIWAVCDEYTWCLPPHLNGRSKEIPHGSEGPVGNPGPGRDHRHMVDLFASETGAALAEILRLLGDRLTPLVSWRARREVFDRVLAPYQSAGPAFGWETSDSNWAAVCGGSVGSAALYLIPEDDALLPVLYRVLGAMESFLGGYTEDGACREGVAYWEYGFGYYVWFAELLRQRTAGRIDLLSDEKVRGIAQFPQKCYLFENRIASFSDTGTVYRHHPGLFCRLKERVEEVKIPEQRFECGLYDDICHRWCPFIRDFVWSRAESRQPFGDAAFYLEDAQWMVARRTAGETSIGFAAKGGNNNEPHNHNDLGSFVYCVNGDMLLADLGMGEYTKAYFGPERYQILCNGSQGHSVPIVEGTYQAPGPAHCAQVIEASAGQGVFRLELEKAYDDANLVRLTRCFRLGGNSGMELAIRDEFEFREEPKQVVERFITQYPPILSGNEVRFSGLHGGAVLSFDPLAVVFRQDEEIFVNHEGEPETVYILNFNLKPRGKAIQAEFHIRPAL